MAAVFVVIVQENTAFKNSHEVAIEGIIKHNLDRHVEMNLIILLPPDDLNSKHVE